MISNLKRMLCGVAIAWAVFASGSLFAEEGEYTANTSMATILDDAELRSVMAKHVPDLMGNPEIDQARVISLGELATYVPDQLTDTVIKAILDEMNKLKN